MENDKKRLDRDFETSDHKQSIGNPIERADQGRASFYTGSTTQGGSNYGQGSSYLGGEVYRQGSVANEGANYENEAGRLSELESDAVSGPREDEVIKAQDQVKMPSDDIDTERFQKKDIEPPRNKRSSGSR